MWPFKKPAAPVTESPPLNPNDRLRGGIDNFRIEAGRVRFQGWVLHPEHSIDEVQISICGQDFGAQKVAQRLDVAKAFHTIAHAGESGFSVDVPVGAWGDRAVVEIRIRGLLGGKQVGWYLGMQLARELDLKFPPAHLMKRVAGTTQPKEFAQIGLQAAFDLMNAAETHRPGIRRNAQAQLLDYGCGCGRVAQFLMHFWPALAYRGCDIDAEAIAWDNAQLKQGAFKAMSTTGPLPFEDGAFDLIVGVSVMTHLTREEQHRWLKELARALKPGGLCLLTTQGIRVGHFNPGIRSIIPRVMEEGIVDRFADGALDGVAPPGYYRSTLQSGPYTRKAWAAHFQILDILEAGLDGYQDLVVMERRRG